MEMGHTAGIEWFVYKSPTSQTARNFKCAFREISEGENTTLAFFQVCWQGFVSSLGGFRKCRTSCEKRSPACETTALKVTPNLG